MLKDDAANSSQPTVIAGEEPTIGSKDTLLETDPTTADATERAGSSHGSSSPSKDDGYGEQADICTGESEKDPSY